MRYHRWSRRAVAAVGALASVAILVPDIGAKAYDVETQASAVEDRLLAEGRGVDQDTNLAYRRAQDKWAHDESWVDPLRREWNGTRGVSFAVEFPNRYGASLAGFLFHPKLPWTDPLTGDVKDGRFPTVVITPGLGNWADDYLGVAQQLAEHGYVVLSVEPQGQHLSDVDPNPRGDFCGDGRWREPQEAGLTEEGECAGHDPGGGVDGAPDPLLAPLGRALDGTPLEPPYVMTSTVVHGRRDPEGVRDSVFALYDVFRPRFTFAAIDAADWLVSHENPNRHLVDPHRMGVAGHSAGADGAVVAGNAHRQRRFRAAVAWDTYGRTPAALRPTVPTMWQQSEQQVLFGPWAPVPDPELWQSYRERDRWEAAGLDSYLVALRGSTHQEWVWFPDVHRDPNRSLAGASSEGQQVGAYYTLAWFDRWLKGRTSTAHAADATRRLTDALFDDSVDRTNIGTGRYDPVADRNVPHTIGGEPVVDHLSRVFRSRYAFDGVVCVDVRAGC